ncbi:MAG: PilZ domain-containing protein, partial [Defluviitaleaceae bacterium]|nr:PilZ domain-containing protein [Defluviitaleaceae bacterium]
QVEKVMDGSRILIFIPAAYGKPVTLAKQREYAVRFVTEKGLAEYDAQIEDYARHEGLEMVIMRVTFQGEKTQRREFYRADCLLPARVIAISEEMGETAVSPNAGPHGMSEGVIKDIGGGGIRFITNLDMREHSQLKCLVHLPEDDVEALGAIREKKHFPKSDYQYQYRVMFTGLPAVEQEKIVKFVFAEQRKALQNKRK